MRIAICASEGAPYAKSGGLGDVMEALPAALQRIEGNEVALFLPYYNKIKNNEKYVILDKEVTVTPGAKLFGTKNHPIVIKKGETV